MSEDRLKRATLEEAERTCIKIGRNIKSALPPGWGATLILTSYDSGENGLLTYISTCRREDMIKCLRELAGRLERKEPNI